MSYMNEIDGVQRALEFGNTGPGDRASDLFEQIIDKVTSDDAAEQSERISQRIVDFNRVLPEVGHRLLYEGRFADYHNAAGQVNEILAADPATQEVTPMRYLI